MDNFKIDVTAEKQASLLKAIEIAFAHNAPGGKAESYEIVTVEAGPYSGLSECLNGAVAMVFRWTKEGSKGAVALPFKLDAAGAAEFAQRWLAEQDFGRQPDHDGHNGRGWRVFTGAWGHVGADRYAICGVTPAWAMYGK